MTKEEHETLLRYDYSRGIVKMSTTRRGEKNGLKRRLPDGVPDVTCSYVEDERECAWEIEVPIRYFAYAFRAAHGPDKCDDVARERSEGPYEDLPSEASPCEDPPSETSPSEELNTS